MQNHRRRMKYFTRLLISSLILLKSDISLDLGSGAEYQSVYKHCQGCSYERTHNHNPKIRPSIRGEEGRTETAGRIHRAVVDGYPDNIYQSKGYTDGKTGELSGPFFGSVAPRITRTNTIVKRISTKSAIPWLTPG